MKLITRIIAVLLLAASGMAVAESETQKIAEIGGEITVDSDGKVKAISLANVKDPKVEQFFIGKIKSWKFYPVEINGKPVEATSKFKFNVIATLLPDKKLKQIEYADIHFEPSAFEIETQNKSEYEVGRKPSIIFPTEAFRENVGAIVKIMVDLSADGKVRNAEIFSMALLNTNIQLGKPFVNAFSKESLRYVRKLEYSKDELARLKCKNGCVGTITINFIVETNDAWQSYASVPVAPIPWVVAEEIKNIDEAEQSRLVRLKQDPNEKPIDAGS